MRVTFIPKPGRSSHCVAKDFRPISLSSFVLKTLERLVDLYMKEGVLSRFPLYRNQHAYQVGKSTDSALHGIVARVEKSFQYKEVALGCFMDIEGAFDNTSFDVIRQALIDREVDPVVVRWINVMLGRRAVEADVCGHKTCLWVVGGCPQGGILSPVLWCMVIDSLIKRLNDEGFFAQGYSDDLTVLIRGKFESTLGDQMRRSLRIVEEWCRERGLKVSPKKTDLILFSKRLTSSELVVKVRLFCKDVDLGTQVKYLGVILDQKLNWIAHVKDKVKKALAAFWICKNSFGRSWGLSSRAILWIYTAIIRPMICHGCVVWWPRLDVDCVRKELGEIQRLVCLCVTGAMKTTATAVMEILLDLPPIQTIVQVKAFATADRLQQNGMWFPNFSGGHAKIRSLIADPIFDMPRDRLTPEIDFSRRFKVVLNQRTDWLNGGLTEMFGDGLVGFTDGSKMSEGTGAGIHIPKLGTEDWFYLGGLTSVFQAEVFATLMGGLNMIPSGVSGRDIFICSDSEASMKALTSPIITSKLVKECGGT